VNLPSGPDTSSTVFLGPKGWTEERVMGWGAGHHETLEASEGREPVACEGCGRGMHYRVAQNRRATVCSPRCRVIRDRRRSKEGEPS